MGFLALGLAVPLLLVSMIRLSRVRQRYLLKIAAKRVKRSSLSHSLAVVFPSPLLLDLKNLRDWL
jgi:hypothetical protein